MDTPEKHDDKAPDKRTKEEVRKDSMQEVDDYVKSKQEKTREDADQRLNDCKRSDRGFSN
jgi:hypothetical protein